MPGPQLSLKHFILKQRVLSFYRTAIRASRGDHSNFPLDLFLIFPVIPDAATRKETISLTRYGQLHFVSHILFIHSPLGPHRGQVESQSSGARTDSTLSFRTLFSIMSVSNF